METILLVEDNQKLADVLIKYLHKSGYKVYHRGNGLEGYKLARRNVNTFDLLILDVVLPGMSGIDICQKLRVAQVQLPVIMLTNIADTHSVVAALNLGADDYLTKPFALPELLARIQALLRRPARFEGRELEVGHLKVNPSLRQVSYKNIVLPLRRREYDLLYYLAKNQNQLISREQIILNVWSNGGEPFPNTVDSHIRQLRRRILAVDPSARGVIQTIYGFGYKLGAAA